MVTKAEILHWLEEVKDPEIPMLSLIDLGVIRNVEITTNTKVKVTMTPTFTGCPAMEVMKQDVIDTLLNYGIDDPEVEINFKERWKSDLINEKGRTALKKFGLAPPPRDTLIVDIDILQHVECPHCESHDTNMKSPFGPTLCRSLHYCNTCKQAFEQFKPIE
ncbi:MAG: phenylacetate-CoA oxygenase subunit PaaJ [Cyclobacteriaceae bacterium]|nr:phenylacetate-CoA oxygenase subunit PaaJ [Cyclobacteriaceae bacterium]